MPGPSLALGLHSAMFPWRWFWVCRGFLGYLAAGWRQSPVVPSAGFAGTWLASDLGVSPQRPGDLGQVTSHFEALCLLQNGGAAIPAPLGC